MSSDDNTSHDEYVLRELLAQNRDLEIEISKLQDTINRLKEIKRNNDRILSSVCNHDFIKDDNAGYEPCGPRKDICSKCGYLW